MKRLRKIFTFILVLVPLMFVMTACDNKNKDNDSKNNQEANYTISLNMDMFETNYKIGQSFQMVSSGAIKNNETNAVNVSDVSNVLVSNNMILSSSIDNDKRQGIVALNYALAKNVKQDKDDKKEKDKENNKEKDKEKDKEKNKDNGPVVIGTYTKNGQVTNLYDNDDFEIIGFDSKTAGKYTLTLSIQGVYKGTIEYEIENDPIKYVSLKGDKDFYVGEEVENVTLMVVYESGFTDYVKLEDLNKEYFIDTSTVGEQTLVLEEYNDIEIKYNVHDIKLLNINADSFIHNFPIGYSYDFADNYTEVEIETTDGLILNKRIILSGVIDCSLVGEKTITLSNENIEQSVEFSYNVLNILSAEIDKEYEENKDYVFLEEELPEYIDVNVIMDNGVEFGNIQVLLPEEFEYDASTKTRTYKITYQNYTFDYNCKVRTIESISVDGLWNGYYFLGEKFDSTVFDEDKYKNVNIATNSNINKLTIGYLNILETYYPEIYYQKIDNSQVDEKILYDNRNNGINGLDVYINGLDVYIIGDIFNLSTYHFLDSIYIFDFKFFNSRAIPLKIKFDDGSEEIRFCYDDISWLENFDTSSLGDKTINLSYNGIEFSYEYKVVEISNINVQKDISCGESLEEKVVTAEVNYKSGGNKKTIYANDYMIFDTDNKVVFKFGNSDDYKKSVIVQEKQIIKDIVEVISQKSFHQFEEVNSISVKIINKNNASEIITYSCKLPTSECGSKTYKVLIGGKSYDFSYDVVGVKEIKVDYEKLELYKDFPDIEIIPLIATYTDESVVNLHIYLFEPMSLKTEGSFSKKLYYQLYNTTYEIPFEYEVSIPESINIKQEEDIYIMYGEQTKRVRVNVEINGKETSKQIEVEFDDYLSVGVHTQSVSMYGETFDIIYSVEYPTSVEFKNLVYQVGQDIAGNICLKSKNCNKDIYLDSSMTRIASNDNNIAISGFDTSTLGAKQFTFHYFEKDYTFNYIVGEIEKIEIANDNDRFLVNQSRKIKINIKFKGIDEFVASYSYSFYDSNDNLGKNTYTFTFNEKQYTFNYTVYDYEKCLIVKTDNVDKIEHKIVYLKKNETIDGSVELKYIIETTDGKQIDGTKGITIDDTTIGNHTQNVTIEGFNFEIQHEITEPDEIFISLTDCFEIDNDKYIIKGLQDTVNLQITKIYGETKYYENISLPVSDFNVGLVIYEMEIVGQKFQFVFEVLELDEITATVDNDIYVGYMQDLNITYNIKTKQGVNFSNTSYHFRTVNPDKIGLFDYVLNYYGKEIVAKYEVLETPIESIEILDDSIPLLYGINSIEEVLKEGCRLKVNYKDGSCEILKYTNVLSPNITLGRKNFYLEKQEQLQNFLFNNLETFDDVIIVSWQGCNVAGTHLIKIAYKGFTQEIEYEVFSEFIITGAEIVGLTEFGKSLEEIIIPFGITAIADYVFKDCGNLLRIEIPESVNSIGKGAFYNCTNLFDIILPSQLTMLEEELLYNCIDLHYINIPENIVSIGKLAFYNCTNLFDIILPNGINVIGENAFCNSGITSISLPKSITEIKDSAFDNCDNLCSVYYYGTISDWCGIIFENAMSNPISYVKDFYLCDEYGYFYLVSEIVINDVKNNKINDYAFYGFLGVTNLSIIYLVDIGDYAFANCLNLQNVYLMNICTSIGFRSFYNCSSLLRVEGNKLIGGYSDKKWFILEEAFYNCSSLTYIDIPEQVTSIGARAFFGCSKLETVIIENIGTWYCTDDADKWKNKVDGTKMDVSNSSTNAISLRTFYNYYWYRK